MTTREWGGLILESRTEYGKAARRNRGNYSGQKVHKLRTEYVIGVTAAPAPRSFGEMFLMLGKPVLFSAYPCCGVTQGQHAGSPYAGLAEADVTCDRCKTKGGAA